MKTTTKIRLALTDRQLEYRYQYSDRVKAGLSVKFYAIHSKVPNSKTFEQDVADIAAAFGGKVVFGMYGERSIRVQVPSTK